MMGDGAGYKEAQPVHRDDGLGHCSQGGGRVGGQAATHCEKPIRGLLSTGSEEDAASGDASLQPQRDTPDPEQRRRNQEYKKARNCRTALGALGLRLLWSAGRRDHAAARPGRD